MRRINLPAYTVVDVFELCVNSIRNKERRLQLLSITGDIATAEIVYRFKGADGQLFSVPTAASVGGSVDGSVMQDLYTKTFSRKGGPTRYIYDAIKGSAPGGICPLCNQRTVSTLDHYLAKSRHPALTITPLNLVPACKDCNTDSQVRIAASAAEQTLHPYFDSVDDDVWLVASVLESSPPAVTFSANPPSSWAPDKQGMVCTHFSAFNLGTLYTTHAASELINVYFDIVNAGKSHDEFSLQAHFRERANNRRNVVRNSWQAAMYQALADSKWFCAGGYKEIVKNTSLNRDI